MSLAVLEQAAQQCTLCPLHTGGRCFGTGPEEPWLVVVYARPPKPHAYTELFAEVPFYETAITKCDPAESELYEEDVRACEPFLTAQLKHLDPTVILAMGREAAQALHSESPGRWRGQTFLWEGVRVITTFHPDLLELVPEADAAIRADINAALRRIKETHGDPT